MARTPNPKLSSGMRCAKFILFMISIMFAITAVLLVLIGSTIGSILGDFKLFVDSKFFSPPALLVVIGFLLLAVSVFGAYGAIKESVLIINIFGVFLFLVFVLEFSAAIAAFIMQTQVRTMLTRKMTNALEKYESNAYVRSGVDFMQTGLECCGIRSPMDWQPFWDENMNLTGTEFKNEVIVPSSCCHEWSAIAPDVCAFQNEYGCLHRMDYIISQSTMLIATGAMTVAFVQLLGVLCAFMLAKTLRRNKSLREARRWQLQQSLGILISQDKKNAVANNNGSGYIQLEKNDNTLDNQTDVYAPGSSSVC